MPKYNFNKVANNFGGLLLGILNSNLFVTKLDRLPLNPSALLAIDRYIAVTYTLKYQTTLTERKFLWVISPIIPGMNSIIASSHDEYKRICTIIFINLHFAM